MPAGGRVGQAQRLGRAAQAAGFGHLHKEFDFGPAVHDVMFFRNGGKLIFVSGHFHSINKVYIHPHRAFKPVAPTGTPMRNLNQDTITQAVHRPPGQPHQTRA
jgi:hypothetical protein